MTELEELREQIKELKSTVDRLQSGESHYESVSVKNRRIKQEAIEKYYGTCQQFRDADIACTPRGKKWRDGVSLYNNVKKVCNKSKISINALEKELNFPRGSICKWDKNTPGIDKVKAVADYFNVPIDYFLS